MNMFTKIDSNFSKLLLTFTKSLMEINFNFNKL